MTESVTAYDFLGPPTEAGDLGSLAHYRVLDELGKGGMGYVFRAEDSKLRRVVALKVMNQKIAATANSRHRFLHEARAMAAVRHDNVCTIFEVGESNDTPFMAMEMLRGGTLETFNKEHQRLDYEKIIDYAQQIARGLSAAHEKGIIHRDIKPANLWIEEGIDRIKILDFGLALAETPVDHLAGRGAVIGTPGYLSPEQARSEPLDDRSDLYSLGVVLYELCTGQLPLQAKSVSGQLIAILAHRPTPINELNPDVPKPLCDLIHRLLRKEPKARPKSALVLDQELDRVRGECEASSEVAQAINKLQAGLSQVVGSAGADSLVDAIDELPAAVPDPLAAAPAASFNSASSGSYPAASGGYPAVKPAAAKERTSAKPNWALYAPLLAMVAIIVTVLPLMAFFFSRAGTRSESIVTELVPEPDGSLGSSAANDDLLALNPDGNRDYQNQLAKLRAERQAGPPPAVQRQPPREIATSAGGSAATSAAETVESEAEATPSAAGDPPTPATAETPPPTAAESPATATDDTPDPPSPDPSPDPSPPRNEPPPVPQAPPKPVQPAKPLVWNEVSTKDGSGGDVWIRKGYPKNLNDQSILGLRTRFIADNPVETEHSYLRFDLGFKEPLAGGVKACELMLSCVGQRPVGALIRVRGVDDFQWSANKLVWRDSPSDNGLDSAPPLADLVIAADPVQPELVKISSPKLTEFVARQKPDSITLVIAGIAADKRSRLEFHSDSSTDRKAPRLRVQIEQQPEPVPADDSDETAPEGPGETEADDTPASDASEPAKSRADQARAAAVKKARESAERQEIESQQRIERLRQNRARNKAARENKPKEE